MGQKEKLIIEITRFIFRLGFKTGANGAMPHIMNIILKSWGKKELKF